MSFHSIDLPQGSMLHSTWLSQLLTSSSFSLPSSPSSSSSAMFHCVCADCCSDRPLGGQFNGQVFERTSSDTEIKCLVFGFGCWLSGESGYLPNISHEDNWTNTATLNKARDESKKSKEGTLVLRKKWGEE